MSIWADEWRNLSNHYSRFSRLLSSIDTVNVNSPATRAEARELSQTYFRHSRAILVGAGLSKELEILDSSFQNLLRLSEGQNLKSSYLAQIRPIRKIFPDVAARIELHQSGNTTDANITSEDRRIIETLENLVPSAALSFRQALTDLADSNRISFRGPALELREALRETLDHLAPDKDVISSENYKQEDGRKGPTMKQKVRFIRKARGQSKSSSAIQEQTTSTIDEMIGNLTRSIYEKSSAAAHVASERKSVLQIRRYIVAVLHDILEL